MSDPTLRFKVALSFAGEQRHFVERVARRLGEALEPHHVLFDRDHEGEFGRRDLDLHLETLYGKQSELIAVFLSADYERKDWCRLEWRVLRNVMMEKGDKVVLFRFDDTPIPGLHPTDGYVEIKNRSPEAIAEMILKRLEAQHGGTSNPGTNPPAATDYYRPLLVLSVHEAATAGRDQNTLADALTQSRIDHAAYDIGRFDHTQLTKPDFSQEKIDGFYDFYSDSLADKAMDISLPDYMTRPSVIAHGAAAYVVGHAMQRFPDIRFDKIVLCGSLLSADFDWSTLFHRDQVNLVYNEYGPKDVQTTATTGDVDRTALSGVSGFHAMSSVILQKRFEQFDHRNYFHKRHIEAHWLPVLRKEPSPLLVRHGRNMDDGVYLFDAAFAATGKIDDLCFSNLEGFREISEGLGHEWIEIEPDIYTFLFNRRTNMACGYINAMPVTDECFDQIMRGNKDDADIKAADVVAFHPQSKLRIYLMSVAIDPKLRRDSQGLLQEPLERLVTGFAGKLYHYAVDHGIIATEIVAVGWTTPGRKLCEALGMSRKGEDVNRRPIYGIDFKSAVPSRSLFPSVQRLAETYKRMLDVSTPGDRPEHTR